MKTRISIQLFFFLFFLCHVNAQQSHPCSEEELKTIEKITQGDLQTLKDYMDNGGDPEFQCRDGMIPGGRLGGPPYYGIQKAVELSNSIEMMQLFLSYPLPQGILDDLMSYYSYPENDPHDLITPILIAKGGHVLNPDTFRIEDGEKYVERLHKLKYNLDWVDTLGNTMIMNIAASHPNADSKIVKGALGKLIDLGVRTDMVNNSGYTLKTIPYSPKIRRYLRRRL